MVFEKYFYADREVVVFVDEAGDPTMRDPGNPLFLFGACMTTGGRLQSDLRDPWMQVREAVLGDRQEPLHMRELNRRLREDQLEAILKFFRQPTFKRVSFAVTSDANLEFEGFPKAPVLELMLNLLLRNVAELTFGNAYVDGLTIVFEEGPLAERMKKFWPKMRLQRKDGEGVVSAVPVTWAVLKKDAKEPGVQGSVRTAVSRYFSAGQAGAISKSYAC